MEKMKIYKEIGENEYFLKLRESDVNNGVELVVVDENGMMVPNGYLLLISFHDGTIKRFNNINPKFGFKYDEVRRIVVENML